MEGAQTPQQKQHQLDQLLKALILVVAEMSEVVEQRPAVVEMSEVVAQIPWVLAVEVDPVVAVAVHALALGEEPLGKADRAAAAVAALVVAVVQSAAVARATALLPAAVAVVRSAAEPCAVL